MRAVAWCAAMSGALYYWFTMAVVVRSLGLPSGATPVLRAVAVLAVGAWAVRTLRQDSAALSAA